MSIRKHCRDPKHSGEKVLWFEYRIDTEAEVFVPRQTWSFLHQAYVAGTRHRIEGSLKVRTYNGNHIENDIDLFARYTTAWIDGDTRDA